MSVAHWQHLQSWRVVVAQPADCPDEQPVFFCTDHDLLCVAIATYAAASFEDSVYST